MTDPILIVGGYGIVGFQIAQVIRKRNPDQKIILAGRSIEKGSAAAKQLGNANAVALDISSEDPLAEIPPHIGAILAAVNDPENALMKSAIRRKVVYVDITRWTERLHDAHKIATALQPESPVVLSSSWMAGVSAIVALKACENLSVVDEITTSILFRVNDKAGPDSVEYADRLSIPFRVWAEGQWSTVKPLTDPMIVEFPSGDEATAYRFDEPSQETLAAITNAKSVSSRIAYDDPIVNRLMLALVRSGFWKLISGSLFTSFRRFLIYKPGEGASHEIVVKASGKSKDGKTHYSSATILAPKGQTHLTALGAYVQLCVTMGLEDQSRRSSGIFYPEKDLDPYFALKVFREEGVAIQFSPLKEKA
ncbi:MAG: saccharopine dehydrogenase NADP-binding domain-containing protein [Parasphingorhabdus sp.]